jgi:hypothetical protein
MELAIEKLYTAFHNDQLNPECCCQCAVGNICDNRDFWKNFTEVHGSVTLNYVGRVNEAFGKKFYGYSPLELLKIEAEFLIGCGYSLPIDRLGKRPERSISKETLFEGLSRVVAFLCVLDDIPNVMDCSQLFDYGFKKNKSSNNLNIMVL